MLTFKIQYDESGHFRIYGVYPSPSTKADVWSPWVTYRSIAHLVVEGKTYIAVSEYFDGILPFEKVMELGAPLPTTLEEVERRTDEQQQDRVIPVT